jgi:SAM-dependent methyltransferase
MTRVSERSHWDEFWTRDRALEEIYDNDDRICLEVTSRMSVDGLIVLEVGAATARDSLSLARHGASVIALDYSHEALRLAREASESVGEQLLLVCGDAEALPFRDSTLDLVFHQGVMEHFRDPGILLSENARVLRTGGILLVDVPQTFHVYTVMKKVLITVSCWFAGWETQYTAGRLSALLRRYGFQPGDTYARFFSPSLAYRVSREVLMRVGIRLPLRPVLVPPVHRLRKRIRNFVERSTLGPGLGCIIGMFARKTEGRGT